MSASSNWIGPSILTADFLQLGDQIATVAESGVDFIHLDVMDGRFVPNISFGFPIIEAVRRATTLPLDVHLMIEQPEQYLEDIVAAGADSVTIQIEATVHSHRAVARIRELGSLPGVALCPGTPLLAIEELIPFVDTILIMTVNPGFGGQAFIPTMLDKITRARALIEDRNPQCRLEIDGGVTDSNIRRIADAGGNTFVVGSSIFDGTANIVANTARLRSALEVA